ncbi:hypothetical protein J3F84DRAFT_56624 [Trichoderma pleuroticola]
MQSHFVLSIHLLPHQLSCFPLTPAHGAEKKGLGLPEALLQQRRASSLTQASLLSGGLFCWGVMTGFQIACESHRAYTTWLPMTLFGTSLCASLSVSQRSVAPYRIVIGNHVQSLVLCSALFACQLGGGNDRLARRGLR